MSSPLKRETDLSTEKSSASSIWIGEMLKVETPSVASPSNKQGIHVYAARYILLLEKGVVDQPLIGWSNLSGGTSCTSRIE
jgi:hypothetical protein